MRIVGGEFRGRPLLSPKGSSTRPTSDRARESIFNILGHAKWLKTAAVEGALVLDAFAGTGALGLEALSRGAGHAVFIERDRAASSICMENIDKFGVSDRSLLLTGDATRPNPRPADLAARSLVFLDPPYGKNLIGQALAALNENAWLAPGAVCVAEMSAKAPEETPPGFTLQDERRYGIALVRFLTCSS
jgi:16S rRNA (guanine966-N2)-methyltransferase